MSWLDRVWRGRRPEQAPPQEDEPMRLLREGYDCEDRGELAEAERHYRRVLEIDATQADALYYLARLASRDRRDEEAIALLQQAVEHRPGEALFLFALAEALFSARQMAEAVDVYAACVALLPECTAMRNNYAAALIELNRREEARAELERLLVRLPDEPMLHFNLGGIYREYGRSDDAIAAYRRALRGMPGHAPTWNNLLLELNYSASQNAAGIAAEHRRFGEEFGRAYAAPAPDPAWPRPLRVGYVSPDFRDHVVMRFLEPILANHDRAQFEVFCYHTHARKDSITQRLRGLVAHWADCEELEPAALAERIRADRIDILVDLAGHTAGNSLLAFALKPAPVQASYLGYPNTTGLGAVDFRITDAWADPPGESDRLSVERLERLPRTYFCYQPEPDSPPVGALPASESGVVTFGCFNNFAKLSGPFYEAAAAVLAAVPRSRLLLKGRPLSIAAVADGVRARFAQHGIEPQRLELRGWEPVIKSHLAIYGSVDIALDSFPYNGATTTCEALWMGVPVVTLSGDRHAARAAASLLHAVGQGDWVAHDVAAYVTICQRLASDLDGLAALRGALRGRMQGSPLMDGAALAQAMERSYREMWEKRNRTAVLPGVAAEAPATEQLAHARRLRETGRAAEARVECESLLQRAPAQREALALLWDLAFDSGAPGSAIEPLNRAIAAAAGGDTAEFHYMLGCVLQAQGKNQDAIAAFRRSLALDPQRAKAQNNLGCTLEAAGDLQTAADCYRAAVRLDPGVAQAHYNLGNACRQLGDLDQAARHMAQAISLEPRHADWHCNLGDLHYAQLRPDEAISSFEAALRIDAADGRAQVALGGALLLTGLVEEANAAFAKGVVLQPERADIASRALLALHYREGEDAPKLFQAHRAWGERYATRIASSTACKPRARNGRALNIGYVSADFARHPLASFIEPVLAAHDRAAVNLFCYMSADAEDDVTRRLQSLGGHWRNISRISDHDAADRVRADGIDVLVDLAGHAGNGRPLLFAHRAAPVQATWLGYPNTTGIGAMDFRLSDAVADPEGETGRFHSETLLRLPNGFLCYAPPRDAPPVRERPVAHGDGAAVTFACFNDLARISPQVLDVWGALLRELPEARLLLHAYGFAAASARRRLLQQLEERGVAGARVELSQPEASFGAHLARYGDADIALDVFPCNGTTTTCEALWMGVPVVALRGKTHVARTGASILSAAGLPQLIAETPQQYLELARRLAEDHAGRNALRAGMRERLGASALLDARGFASQLEAAYAEMLDAKLRAQA
jgi:predicted O-linked N-acetylglucosamine transferase (SPINDLY family)